MPTKPKTSPATPPKQPAEKRKPSPSLPAGMTSNEVEKGDEGKRAHITPAVVPIAPDDPQPPLPTIPPYLVTVSLVRSQAEHLLGTLMSQISKRCYDSRWITGTEESLIHLTATAVKTGTLQRWGKDSISVEEAETIRAFHETLGYVVTEKSGTGGAAYIPYRPAKQEDEGANGED